MSAYQDGRDGAAVVLDQSQRVLDAICPSYRVLRLPLMAGQDSRAVLAAARDVIRSGDHEVKSFTATFPGDLTSLVDAEVAAKVAHMAGIGHEVFDRPATGQSADVIDHAFRSIGEAKSGTALRPSPALEHDPTVVLELIGVAGELARRTSFYRRVGDVLWSDRGLRPEHIVAALSAPLHARVSRASNADVLDFAFLEQRLGAWVAPQEYVPHRRSDTLAIMGSTRSVEAMLSLPVDYRRQGALQRDMVSLGRPELLALPINAPISTRLKWRTNGRRTNGRRTIRRVKSKVRRLGGS